MRPIKFRAWVKSEKRMEYFPLFWNHSDYLNEDDSEVMQFTGLHDKNGKEIFEGDVLSVIGAYSGEMKVLVDDIAHMQLTTLYPAGEVLGNIYENPSLLERSQK